MNLIWLKKNFSIVLDWSFIFLGLRKTNRKFDSFEKKEKIDSFEKQ
jgi:hypothetical protein